MTASDKTGLGMSFTSLLVPTYIQMLGRLSAWLKKAQAQRADDAETLLSARLVPDMFPLATQIRFACRQAQEAVFRLKGEAFPASSDVLLEEGRNAGEHPGSIADAQTRIAETLDLLNALPTTALDIDRKTPIAHALPAGMTFDLTAEQFARDWALPQFYFHLMTAYALLRANGIDLGKTDYVAHMLPYLRPGSMPQG